MSSFRWRDLPAELRLMILNHVAKPPPGACRRNPPKGRGLRSLARYATVSYEWQQFFEQINFNRFVLRTGTADLNYFLELVTRRRTHAKKHEPACTLPVKHIWLIVVLLPYPHHEGRLWCQDCRKPESDTEVIKNDVIFTNAMWNLFIVLALIGPSTSGNQNQRGLTLEISASSPSDSKHNFRAWYHLQDDYPHLATEKKQMDFIASKRNPPPELDDISHGFGTQRDRLSWVRNMVWAGGVYDRERCECAQRLVRPLKLDFREVAVANDLDESQLKLPEASIVTGFLIRRQFFRDISTSSLSKLLESLSSLKTLRRENWRLITNAERGIDDYRYALPVGTKLTRTKGKQSRNLLTAMLPKSLTDLHLFEDFEVQLHGRQDAIRPRDSRIELLPSLAHATPNLKSLSVCFLTDAIDCFGLRGFYLNGRLPGYATYHFPHLEHVILTSQEHLRRDQDHRKINALLRAAAAVALKMPKLKIMELWNCGRGQASLFRYDGTDASAGRPCRLTWRSNWGPSWDLTIQPDVVDAWEKVALANEPRTCFAVPRPIRLECSPLPDEIAGFGYLSYGSILRHLKLARVALHRVSAMQAASESVISREKLLWCY